MFVLKKYLFIKILTFANGSLFEAHLGSCMWDTSGWKFGELLNSLLGPLLGRQLGGVEGARAPEPSDL